MDLSSFGSLQSITIPTFFLWIIFLLALLFYVIISIVFLYHWNRYGGRNMIILVGGTIYFVGSIIMFGVAIVALLSLV